MILAANNEKKWSVGLRAGLQAIVMLTTCTHSVEEDHLPGLKCMSFILPHIFFTSATDLSIQLSLLNLLKDHRIYPCFAIWQGRLLYIICQFIVCEPAKSPLNSLSATEVFNYIVQ